MSCSIAWAVSVTAPCWIGEIEGIDLTFTFLRAKRDEIQCRPSDQLSTSGSPRAAARRSPNDLSETDAWRRPVVIEG
jgi:hypothetical protein